MNTYDPAAGILYVHMPREPDPRVGTPVQRPPVRQVASRIRRSRSTHTPGTPTDVPAGEPAGPARRDVPLERQPTEVGEAVVRGDSPVEQHTDAVARGRDVVVETQWVGADVTALSVQLMRTGRARV